LFEIERALRRLSVRTICPGGSTTTTTRWMGLSPRPSTRGLASVPPVREGALPSRGRIYLNNDNTSTHWTESPRRITRALRITMAATPTNASESSPIEAHFGELRLSEPELTSQGPQVKRPLRVRH
jgi:hypothetical protein